MFKYILSLVLFLPFNVFSQQIILPEPVKEQSGFYLVQPDYVFNFSHILENTGVAIEIYEAGERHNIIDYTIPKTFIFGGYFDSNGYYITFQGQLDDVIPNKFNVTINFVSMGITQNLGVGTIEFDPSGSGNSHVANFVFYNNQQYSVMPEYVYYGTFLRISGNTIKKCIPLVASNYTQDQYVNCNH